MIFSLKKWTDRIKFMIIFIVLTYMLAMIIQWVFAWIEPTHRYKHPTGKAVKVIQQEETISYDESMLDRLKFFYWYGE